ncbi:MAG: hypothetical protein KJ063_25710 [Anaerolineae bacterium]|nr:hypothetical protein [Anaerolineae bacterium]
MISKKPHTLGGVAYTSAGGTWEERILSLDIESVDQNLSRYFSSQMRVGVSARREKTETGTITYFVHIPGCQEVPIGTPHQPCVIIELVKLGNQTRFIATANDRDRDRLFQLIEKLESFLYPANMENLHHRLEPTLVTEIIGRRIMSVGYTYQLENDTFIVIHEGHELGRILLSTQRPGLYFEYSMPSQTGVGERYVPRSPQDGFQPVDDDTMRFRELIHMIHEDVIGQIELNDMRGRWTSPQTDKIAGDTAVTRQNEQSTETENTAIEVRLPSRRSDLKKWQQVWQKIQTYVDAGWNANDIEKEIHTRPKDYKNLPTSAKTLREIIAAGNIGLLDQS